MPSVKLFADIQNLNLHENAWNNSGVTSGILFMNRGVMFFNLYLPELNNELYSHIQIFSTLRVVKIIHLKVSPAIFSHNNVLIVKYCHFCQERFDYHCIVWSFHFSLLTLYTNHVLCTVFLCKTLIMLTR